MKARLDKRRYATGKKVTEQEMRDIQLERHSFHDDWNYTIRPHDVV